MRVAAIIAAGGRGLRAGGGVPKQLRSIGGRTLLELALAPFDRSARVAEIVVVLPPESMADPPIGFQAVETPLRVVAGGRRRQDSVAAGLDAVGDAASLVLVHDAARPFCSQALIGRVIDAAAEAGAAVPAVQATDTVKQSADAGGHAVVAATLPRERIHLAQTPQGFRIDVLRAAVALGRSGADATDEALLAERAGYAVRLVEGDPENVKITTPADLDRAAGRMVRARVAPAVAVRVGIGYDLHRTVAGRPLILAGVHVPHDRGLDGHSDADAVCHALIDAVLGGAAAGDVGQHFSNRDPRWKGASSIDLLERAVAIVRERGYAVGNADVVVIAERPRIGPHAAAMRERLAEALEVAVAAVSVKAKTGEGVDAVGRGEAIAVHAVATLVSR
ncbi:MAG: 2-C-methyl-D-erythritol 4-phosphate cytidylyltransferase [Acidobacteria bacterium]|nr:2-C-methyl-D-erythritol 4-phosphate cytidylyltransferase [Acidobacteriota bacterium]